MNRATNGARCHREDHSIEGVAALDRDFAQKESIVGRLPQETDPRRRSHIEKVGGSGPTVFERFG